MIDLFKAAVKISAFLHAHRENFCFIGGIALQRWGQQRLTVDIDLIALTKMGNEEQIIDELLKEYSSRIPDGRQFALDNRILLLQTSDEIEIDLALGIYPYEELMISRSSDFEFLPGASIPTCSAEDLVINKAWADRPQDWVDVEGILQRQKSKLDWDYIFGQLKPLCEIKESPEIWQKLEKFRIKVDNQT